MLALLIGSCAAIYAMVGFGGGSAYLAVLTLWGYPHALVVPLALLLNVLVVSGGAWHFARAGHLRFRLLLPFLVTSMPAAYVGARLHVDADTWKYVAALLLLLSAALMALRFPYGDGRDANALPARELWRRGPIFGAVMGLAAGVVGVGGGVFLAPLLHLLGWGRTKQIAAAASMFILLNSFSGLAGHAQEIGSSGGTGIWLLLGAAVIVGGQLGSRLGAYHVSAAAVRTATAAVLVFAGSRLFLATPLGAGTGALLLLVAAILLLLGAARVATAVARQRAGSFPPAT